MNKYGIVITILAALLVGAIVYICCDKFNKSKKCDCTGCCNCKPEEDEDFKLIAETTTDDTYYRAELLSLGNVYESQWDKRYFEKGEFQYDIECTSNVFDTKFAILDCGDDKVTIETEGGDTMTLFNVKSSGKNVTFDMFRDDNSLVHFTFTTNQDMDFLKALRSTTEGNNTKIAWVAVAGAIGAGTGVVSAAVAIVAYVRSERNRKCDITKRNGERQCGSYGCGIWEGDCCVKCLGGDAHPNCNHIGEVIGDGSDCNSH